MKRVRPVAVANPVTATKSEAPRRGCERRYRPDVRTTLRMSSFPSGVLCPDDHAARNPGEQR